MFGSVSLHHFSASQCAPLTQQMQTHAGKTARALALFVPVLVTNTNTLRHTQPLNHTQPSVIDSESFHWGLGTVAAVTAVFHHRHPPSSPAPPRC